MDDKRVVVNQSRLGTLVRALLIVVVSMIAVFFGAMLNVVDGKELHVAAVAMCWSVIVWKIINYQDGLRAYGKSERINERRFKRYAKIILIIIVFTFGAIPVFQVLYFILALVLQLP